MKNANQNQKITSTISRRTFVRTCVTSASTLAALPILGCRGMKAETKPAQKGPAAWTMPLDRDWLFGGKFDPAAVAPEFNDVAFARVTLPHCVAKLSWQNWDAADWQQVWIYRRHFALPKAFAGQRVFVHFDGVMVGATPTINGHALPEHLGAYLPFHYEITDWIKDGDNVLAVKVDSRWSNVPPEGNPKGTTSVDFLEPGGIPRSVSLRAVPQVFISDVFARPMNVLAAKRRVEVACTIDAAAVAQQPCEIKVTLLDGSKVVASAQKQLTLTHPGETEVALTLSDLGNIALWDVDAPRLYDVVTTLSLGGQPLHDHRTRIGFREARFEADGFFLNGRRLQLFGLNRHEIYPYVGFAMPRRVMRRDAEILRHDFNCNAVRCSHYPQSAAFLDACDELGLLVWEELPGWGYIGDAAWQDVAVRDVKDMIRRDRNRPSVVIWGVRVNESKNNPALYQRTTALAKSLDDSRPTSGAMIGGLHSTKDWSEDVFAYNDYAHDSTSGKMNLNPPLAGVPYLITEAVGQVVGIGPSTNHIYRRVAEPALQTKQALYHAQTHDQAGRDKYYSGVIAWCGFEYASSVKVALNGVKYPGVADMFRIPKLGAAFYQSQISPQVRPVIQPNFYWDFGPKTPQGPGKHAAIFSNCDRLELFINGKPHATVLPDRATFPHLKYPPFFTELELDGTGQPELRIEGYVNGKPALSKSFSSNVAHDQFILATDDVELTGDGADATRLVFKVADKFGAPRAFGGGEVGFELSGPGVIVGDNPFLLADSGGVGAIWIRTALNGLGRITVRATHSLLGTKLVAIHVKRGPQSLGKA
jgi:beta-galactosidase